MTKGLKVLIVDDEPDLLEFYKKLVSDLPSQPEVHTATNGARALALLESEPFSLLITDLNMPRMDGFQVLMMVRRKFPSLRTAVITGMTDPQYRARAYAIGIDLYIEKPQNKQELKLFTDCIEGVLDRVDHGGFRGVQSKSLVDLVQMECLSQGNSVLKVVNGTQEGRIWILNGEITDAAQGELAGEPAFRKILSWQTGSFEILPAEPEHQRKIQATSQTLLLSYAQSIDEAEAEPVGAGVTEDARTDILRAISRIDGVETVLSMGGDGIRSWAVEQPEELQEWAQALLKDAESLGERLGANPLKTILAANPVRKYALQGSKGQALMLGMRADLPTAQAHDILKKVMGDWTK